MSMYSGIGSFAKKFQTGGGVQQEDGGSSGGGSGSSTTGTPLTFDEFVAAYGGNPGGLIGGLAADVAYQAYLQAYSVSGGNVDVTNGNFNVRAKAMPSYMQLTENNQVLIPVGTTNRQFIEAMNLLGLLPEDDYSWLTQYFTGGNGDGTWLADIYNRPDTNVNRDNFFGNNNLNAENTSIMNRLFDVFDTGSQAGGFTASQGFLNEYSTPTTPGQNYGSGASRPVFIGPPPTGGTAEQPYYSLSDVFVSSSEQPNLYDRFDPYPEGGFETVNPYTGQVTTPYSYRPPAINVDTGTTTGTDLVFETEEAEEVAPVVGAPEVVDTTQGTGGTGITVDESAVTGTTDTAGSATTSTTAPTSPLTGYQGIAAFKDQDPYLFGKRGMVQGLQALAGSRRDLTAEEFQSLLGGQQGRYGEGSTLAYDPRFGVYSTISDAELQRLREAQALPDYIDPRLMTDVERIRSNHMGGGTYSRSVTDEAGNVYKINRDRQTTRIGDTQYFVNEDGSVTAYDVKDIKYDRTPKFGGFADGGIVSIAGDFSGMDTTGEGIESFLNPERSKATLRRNLAKLAPRPTAPVPTMQQGIMPMAR